MNKVRMKAWHFCRNDRRLGFNDGRHIRTGRTLKVGEPILLCKRGLHASKNITDALYYARGEIICLVQLSGKILHDLDKSVATERTVLAMADATNILHEFACRCAERALRKAKVKDKRCWEAIETKRKWLQKQCTDKELDSGRDAAEAAWDAAWDAARHAAWDAAARNAARDAARNAARGPASAAARGAASDAARNAAWDAGGAAGAAGNAVWAAGRNAEIKWQERLLTKMVKEKLNSRN